MKTYFARVSPRRMVNSFVHNYNLHIRPLISWTSLITTRIHDPVFTIFIPHLDFTPALRRFFTCIWQAFGHFRALILSFISLSLFSLGYGPHWTDELRGRGRCIMIPTISRRRLRLLLSFVWYWDLLSDSLHSVFTQPDWFWFELPITDYYSHHLISVYVNQEVSL